MEPPPGGLSVEEFNAYVAREHAYRYIENEGVVVCRYCGKQVQTITCYVSEHEARFGDLHAGSGTVQRITLPFCPRCEEQPERTSTCVHMPLVFAPLGPPNKA